MGRLRVTEKEGEINNGRREGERRKQRTRRGGREREEREARGLCASGAMFSSWRITTSRTGEEEEKRAVEEGRGEEGKGRGRHHVVNHGPVAPMYYISPARGGRRGGQGGRACTRYCIVAHNVQSSLRRFLRL